MLQKLVWPVLMLAWMILFVHADPPKPPAALTPKPLHFPPKDGTFLVLVEGAIDGDTVHFFWLVPDSARLYGINAPEIHGASAAAGEKAKAFLASKLSPRPMVAVSHGKEKYGRSLIELYDEGGKSLSALMVESGNAKTWNGQGPRP